jgi:hypothetical protein
MNRPEHPPQPSLRRLLAPGLGTTVTLPAADVALTMLHAASVVISVDFSQSQRPADYIVSLIPEGGEAVGKWSGSGSINAQNQLTFDDIPPGRYVAYGRPNPGSDDQRTAPVTVDLQGGKITQIKLKAR